MAVSDEVLEHAMNDIKRATPPADRVAVLARVCGAYGCSAHLSRYNDSTTCWLHGPGADPMRRRT